ncbi:MAG: DNA topoisomerase (ATP-hydrolyzing) subunit A [Clostridia bacterium]|nr:DNA topoisomerase (ATP-hydrolyzing) subunit A [Clostridia bacterium]
MAKKNARKVPEEIVLAPIKDQAITDTIEKNYMPYAMSVIVSRAIPEIDGFKPSQRKLLYTMYKMGLLTGSRIKSANVVGQTMRLNPHGDAAIYETMVRLTRGNAALLHPFVDSKGSFGKQYSRDMAYAASRYTEVKLDPFCAELFRGIDKDAVDLIPNYDNTTTEPVLFPTTFPNVLVSANSGIAVGMASNICSFNLAEVCDGTIQLLRHPDTTAEQLLELIKAPDFSGGAELLYDRERLLEIYKTGRGSFTVRAKYRYDKANSCIDILEIPYSTSIEAIIKRITDLVKENKLKEVTDIRDEIDLSGFKLTIDLRRGTDPDALMKKLYRLTPLQDDFAANLNILVDGAPRTMGIPEILREWIRFRLGCYKRELAFDMNKKKEKLHLLLGLGRILVDIDKAVKIIRETKKESEVVPNLMAGFRIDQVQAEYIAEIKLRHLNQEYIVERVKEIGELQKEIAEMEAILVSETKQKSALAAQLTEIKKKYGQPRKTQIVHDAFIDDEEPEDELDAYECRVVFTREGYFKKITAQSLRGADEQKLKDGDVIVNMEDTDNSADLLFFTDKQRVYKAKADDFEPVKASAMGDFVQAKLQMDDDEHPVMMKALKEYKASDRFIFIFANGKGVRIPADSYETKTNRKRLTNAFSDASPIVAVFYEAEKTKTELLLVTDAQRGIVISSALVPQKTTRTSAGVTLLTLRGGQKVVLALSGEEAVNYPGASKARKIKIPASAVALN